MKDINQKPTSTVESDNNLPDFGPSLTEEMISSANNFLQPNKATKLSDDFKSRAIASLVMHFKDKNRNNELPTYEIVKNHTFANYKLGYKGFLLDMLKRVKMLDETNQDLVDYFITSGGDKIEELEKDLHKGLPLLERYFEGDISPDYSDENLKLRSDILKMLLGIQNTYFPDISADVSGLIG